MYSHNAVFFCNIQEASHFPFTRNALVSHTVKACFLVRLLVEIVSRKIYKLACVRIEDSDQHVPVIQSDQQVEFEKMIRKYHNTKLQTNSTMRKKHTTQSQVHQEDI